MRARGEGEREEGEGRGHFLGGEFCNEREGVRGGKGRGRL